MRHVIYCSTNLLRSNLPARMVLHSLSSMAAKQSARFVISQLVSRFGGKVGYFFNRRHEYSQSISWFPSGGPLHPERRNQFSKELARRWRSSQEESSAGSRAPWQILSSGAIEIHSIIWRISSLNPFPTALDAMSAHSSIEIGE